uniref:Uncharacterized protein n=1 Tax=Avena sativa TaxID=4498 RepID=A0ACD5UJP4_AVESA
MPPKKYVAPRVTAAAPPAKKRGKPEKEQLDGMKNVEWAFDLQCWQVENASRRQRELRARKKRASEALAMEVLMAQRAAHMAGMPSLALHAWGSQGSVSSRSPSLATTQAGPMSQDSQSTPKLSCFSPCGPLDAGDNFNPNAFSVVDLNASFNPNAFSQGTPNLAASPALRRPLFHGGMPTTAVSSGVSHGVLDETTLGTDAIMTDMINSGGLPPFYTQGEAEAYDGYDNSQEPWENEAYAFAQDDEEEAPTPVPEVVPVVKKKKNGGRDLKWSSREDECLAEAWKSVSIDPFTGANQSSEAYWLRVKAAYDERRHLDPYFKDLYHDRNDSGISHRWHMIQHACNKWHGVVEEVRRVHVSGTNFEDQMHAMITAYHEDNDDVEFKFIHVFARIETCDQWTETRTALAKGKYDPDAPPALSSGGRPIEQKKAKAARDVALAIEKLHNSIMARMADAASHTAERVEQAAKMEQVAGVRWASVIERQDAKLELIRANVAAEKRREDLSILMVDTRDMDADVRAWWEAHRTAILCQVGPSRTCPCPIFSPRSPPLCARPRRRPPPSAAGRCSSSSCSVTIGPHPTVGQTLPLQPFLVVASHGGAPTSSAFSATTVGTAAQRYHIACLYPSVLNPAVRFVHLSPPHPLGGGGDRNYGDDFMKQYPRLLQRICAVPLQEKYLVACFAVFYLLSFLNCCTVFKCLLHFHFQSLSRSLSHYSLVLNRVCEGLLMYMPHMFLLEFLIGAGETCCLHQSARGLIFRFFGLYHGICFFLLNQIVHCSATSERRCYLLASICHFYEQEDALNGILLSAYLHLQSEGLMSTWMNPFVGPWDPSQGEYNYVHYLHPSSFLPKSSICLLLSEDIAIVTNQKIKLWLFLSVRHSLSCPVLIYLLVSTAYTVSQLFQLLCSSWVAPSKSEKVVAALCQALGNSLESIKRTFLCKICKSDPPVGNQRSFGFLTKVFLSCDIA